MVVATISYVLTRVLCYLLRRLPIGKIPYPIVSIDFLPYFWHMPFVFGYTYISDNKGNHEPQNADLENHPTILSFEECGKYPLFPHFVVFPILFPVFLK